MASSVAAGPAEFDLAYVVSDLHLGGEPGRQMFASGVQFTALIDQILKEQDKHSGPGGGAKVRTLLVINGDFVDLLAEPDASVFNMNRAPEMLWRLFQRDEFRPVIAALRKFAAAKGTHLAITLGNHDLELALPAVRDSLLMLLTCDDEDLPAVAAAPDSTPFTRWRQACLQHRRLDHAEHARLAGKIEFCFDGWGYRFQIGGKRAVCLHGNEADPYNFTRYDELDRIVHDWMLFERSEFGASWQPSAGSRFVIEAINPIKHQFPFIDLLKPELPLAAAVLAVLDPTKVVYAEDAVRLKASAVVNDRLKPASQRRMLSAAAAGADPAERFDGVGLFDSSATFGADSIEERTELAMMRDASAEQLDNAGGQAHLDALIFGPMSRELLGPAEWAASLRSAVGKVGAFVGDLARSGAAALQGKQRDLHWRALRSAIRSLVTEGPEDIGTQDESDRAIDGVVRQGYDVVFAGHTHLRRLCHRAETTGYYVNTGTWAGLMSLSRAQVDSPAFEQIYEALRSPDRASLAAYVRHERTVARMHLTDTGKVQVGLSGMTESNDGKFVLDFSAAPKVEI